MTLDVKLSVHMDSNIKYLDRFKFKYLMVRNICRESP